MWPATAASFAVTSTTRPNLRIFSNHLWEADARPDNSGQNGHGEGPRSWITCEMKRPARKLRLIHLQGCRRPSAETRLVELVATRDRELLCCCGIATLHPQLARYRRTVPEVAR